MRWSSTLLLPKLPCRNCPAEHRRGSSDVNDDPTLVEAGVILDWLKTDYDLGRGHGMALVHVIKKGPQIDSRHVGTSGSHSDESDLLWLDGKATKPA